MGRNTAGWKVTGRKEERNKRWEEGTTDVNNEGKASNKGRKKRTKDGGRKEERRNEGRRKREKESWR